MSPIVRVRAVLLCAALLVCSSLSVLVTSASAGSIAVVSCSLPGGAPAPTEGWTSGWTNGPLAYSGSSNTCASSGGSLSSYIGDSIPQPSSDGPYWEYTAPWGFSLIGGQVTATFDIPGPSVAGYSAATGMLGPQFNFDNADFVGGLPGNGTAETEGTYSLTGHTGGHIWLYSFCEPPNSTCPAGGSKEWFWSTFWMHQAILVLANSAKPSGSGFSGGVTTPGAVSGTQDLLFQAADSGSGVYKVKAALGGQTVYEATPSTNAGECVPLGSYGSSLEFVSSAPCPTSESVTIPVNTTLVHDGKHELAVTVIDAAGNEATVYSQLIETKNAPPVVEAPSIAGLAAVGSTLTGTNGSFSAPSGAGVLSGITGQWLRCSDAAATHCSAIAQATGLTYQPQAADVGYYLVYANTVSDSDGSTTADSQPTLAVTAPPTQTSCANSECLHGGAGGSGGNGGAGITINIPGTGNSTLLGSDAKWAVTLTVTPNRVRKGTKIKISGVVTTSPRPSAGKLVYVQARPLTSAWIGKGRKRHRVIVYGEWVTFAHLRSKANGAWHTSHRFKLGGPHVYQLQAVAPQEGGFLDPTGESGIMTITET
jgi:hypothetical protein